MRREPTELGGRVEVPEDESRMAALWDRIEGELDRRAPKVEARRWGGVVAGLCATAAAGVAAFALSTHPARVGPIPDALRVADVSETAQAALARVRDGGQVRWSDGSRLEVSQRATLELLESSGSRVAFLLHRGEARFEIVPGGPRRWVVELGDLSVEVLGTVFQVRRDETGAEILLEEGHILARGERIPGRVRSLTAERGGDPVRLRVPRSELVPNEVLPSVSAEKPKAPKARRRLRPEPPTETPVARPVTARPPAPSMASLMAKADQARRRGEHGEAIELLREAAMRRESPEAALASFTLGRVLAAQGQGEDALHAFRQAVALGLPDAMAERARSRMEALRVELEGD